VHLVDILFALFALFRQVLLTAGRNARQYRSTSSHILHPPPRGGGVKTPQLGNDPPPPDSFFCILMLFNVNLRFTHIYTPTNICLYPPLNFVFTIVIASLQGASCSQLLLLLFKGPRVHYCYCFFSRGLVFTIVIVSLQGASCSILFLFLFKGPRVH